jgi:hypothetical protein
LKIKKPPNGGVFNISKLNYAFLAQHFFSSVAAIVASHFFSSALHLALHLEVSAAVIAFSFDAFAAQQDSFLATSFVTVFASCAAALKENKAIATNVIIFFIIFFFII